MGELAQERGEWAGIPLPSDFARLIIEPTYPYAALGEIGGPEKDEVEEAKYKGWKVRNVWYSDRRKLEYMIIERADGSLTWGCKAAVHHFDYDLQTLGCSDVWGIEQESKAIELLGSMIKHRAFKQYLLTGMFLESSPRSKVVYMFRRLKPTVAFKADAQGNMRILACLCQHPIAYYDGSWAGAMCPTDDVIAHLAMMRGDEHMFWKRCNQHAPHRPEAGL